MTRMKLTVVSFGVSGASGQVGKYFLSAESVGQEAINDSADLFVMVACITLSWRQVAATIDTFIIRQCKS
ncbi:hypothetical protein T02_4470 [Trichinella nativa]|uniref:Uncharacterized protein n=3 Tax=Trichinella TaxID=6333 RepID=A0A0V1KZ68_9BILA|nr:hypothetical protein T05_2233 [Trichinella murrelli]KRX60206.1 hypothetical protein T09_12281 [Trichinella sp. T9]KRY48826.1 hypothetical protein T03_9192 [Trichinella britovi]KRZ52605.1 hypothetical protein T02_4470 [Trichinella nativa]